MITPDYYPLEEAAEKLNCSKTTIIQKGASGELPIYILTTKFLIDEMIKREEGIISDVPRRWREIKGKPINRLAKLTKECLSAYEAGEWLTTPEIEQPSDNDDCMELVYQLRYKKNSIPTYEEIKQAQSIGVDINKYVKKITLNHCEMVVLADDLRNFAQSITAFSILDNYNRLYILKESGD